MCELDANSTCLRVAKMALKSNVVLAKERYMATHAALETWHPDLSDP